MVYFASFKRFFLTWCDFPVRNVAKSFAEFLLKIHQDFLRSPQSAYLQVSFDEIMIHLDVNKDGKAGDGVETGWCHLRFISKKKLSEA